MYKGYKGARCDIHRCPGWPLDCSGHGTCNEALHECDCEPGWKGAACEVPLCAGEMMTIMVVMMMMMILVVVGMK
jgi:hypothetical protein